MGRINLQTWNSEEYNTNAAYVAQLGNTILNEVEKRLKPIIFSEKDGWIADYVRLRFKATK